MRNILYTLLLLPAGLCFAQVSRGLSEEAKPKNNFTNGNTYAFIAGISHYSKISSLKYADEDALLFYKFLFSGSAGRVDSSKINLILNENATGGKLTGEFIKMVYTTPFKSGDRFFIYLAGHGDAINEDQYFFLGSDVSAGNGAGDINNYFISNSPRMSDIKMAISVLAQKGVEVYLILDACRTQMADAAAQTQKVYANGVVETNMGEYYMISCRGGQKSLETPAAGGGHGLFTWHLISGLYGEADDDGDGNITGDELADFVSKTVRKEAKEKYSKDQTPVFSTNKSGNTISIKDSSAYKWWTAYKAKTAELGKPALANSEVAFNDKREAKHEEREAVSIYNKFTKELKSQHFTGHSSAYYYYKLLNSKYRRSELTTTARYALAGELTDYSTGKINQYLEGKDMTATARYEGELGEADAKSTEQKLALIATIPYSRVADYTYLAIELFNNKGIKERMLPKYYFFRAKSYFEKGSTESLTQAVQDIKTALRYQPDGAYLHQLYGILLLKKGEFVKSKEELQRAISLSPGWSYSYCSMGQYYWVLKKPSEAEKWFKKAISLDTLFSEAIENLGNAYLQQEKYNEAESCYLKAMAMDSTATATRLLNLGCYYHKRSDYEKAKQCYQLSINRDSTQELAYNNLAVIAFLGNDLAAAKNYLLSAIRADNNSPRLYDNLGLIYDSLAMDVKAEQSFIKALEIEETYYPAYLSLGNFYHKHHKDALELSILKKGARNVEAHADEFYYNIACNYANKMKVKKTFKYLELAIKHGFNNSEQLNEDLKAGEDLSLLAGTPGMNKILKKLGGN